MIQRNKQKLVAFLLFCIISSFIATVKQHGSGLLAGSLHPAHNSNWSAASAGHALALGLPTSLPLSVPAIASAPESISRAASATDAYAGWQEVGSGSATGSGISSNGLESGRPSLAVAPDGSIYVAWANNTSGDFEIYVRRWNGSSWTQLGANSASGGGISNNGGTSRGPSIAIAPDGTPYVAWHDNSSGDYEIYVKRWNGSSWTEVGPNSASGGGISNNSGESSWPSLVIAANGKPHVSWNDDSSGNFEIYLKRWNGSSWLEVGAGSASGGGISSNAGASLRPSTATTVGGKPYVAWNDDSSGSNEIYIRRWSGTAWEEIGTSSAASGGISSNAGISARASLVLDVNDTPSVAWDDNSSGDFEIYARRWDGAAWVELGPDSAAGGGISNNAGDSRHTDLFADANGQLYAAWEDNSAGDDEIYVRRWDGQAWQTVGSDSASGGGISDNAGASLIPSITLDNNGIPYTAWRDKTSGSYEVYVRRYGSPPCYLLTRSHTGSGGDPVASPNQSYACSSGRYVAGAAIALTANPSTGWRVGSWNGTAQDNSTGLDNALTMPNRSHEVSVNYVESPLIQLATSSLSVNENGGPAEIEIIRSGNVGAATSVRVRTYDGTATAGSDYAPVDTTLTFNAGETRKAVPVAILDDAVAEADENLVVSLSNPSGALLGTLSNLTLTIIDNDQATPTHTPTPTTTPTPTATPTPSVTPRPGTTYTSYLPTLLFQRPGVLSPHFTARWDGELHYRDVNGHTQAGTHLTRRAVDLIDDTLRIDHDYWYHPNPFSWPESTWSEYYSVTDGTLEYTTNPFDPNSSWKWENPWLAPPDWQFADGATIAIANQEFFVEGPLSSDTPFHEEVPYWKLKNTKPFTFFDDGGSVTQRVHPGDIVIHYGVDTRLLIYRFILRTGYVNGSPTSDTVENTTFLASSNVYD